MRPTGYEVDWSAIVLAVVLGHHLNRGRLTACHRPSARDRLGLSRILPLCLGRMNDGKTVCIGLDEPAKRRRALVARRHRRRTTKGIRKGRSRSRGGRRNSGSIARLLGLGKCRITLLENQRQPSRGLPNVRLGVGNGDRLAVSSRSITRLVRLVEPD